MKIWHISDTHGLPKEPVPAECDIIVHSGDLFPNSYRCRIHGGLNAEYETSHQRAWLQSNLQQFTDWVGNRTFLYVPGNHDYADPCPALCQTGIRAHDLSLESICLGAERVRLRFSGFRGVTADWYPPARWNHEMSEEDLKDRVLDALDFSPDVLVSHGPPFGILDQVLPRDRRIGSRSLSNALRLIDSKPWVHLFGHCHESGGRHVEISNIRYFNSATKGQVVEI